jgi:hypothetical protein
MESGKPGSREPQPGGRTVPLEVDADVKRRLKVYAAVTGQTMKALASRWLSEHLPPLPRESEATT